MQLITDQIQDQAAIITYAVNILKAGGLVAFPTETVYGLGADPTNALAIQKVFQVKKRPTNHPLIIHIAELSQLSNVASNIPATACHLAKQYWPGPLTLVLPKAANLSAAVTGGQDTVAVRIPNHQLTLQLLSKLQYGLVGPSANSYGKLSPTTAQHVAHDLGTKLDYIIDGGPCSVGIESTIVYCKDAQVIILREGKITKANLQDSLGTGITVSSGSDLITAPRVSGSHSMHYAPNKPLYLVTQQQMPAIIAQLAQATASQQYGGLALTTKLPANLGHWQQISLDPIAYAKQLYAALHTLDNDPAIKVILVEQPPQTELWQAINDRLARASQLKFLTPQQLCAITKQSLSVA